MLGSPFRNPKEGGTLITLKENLQFRELPTWFRLPADRFRSAGASFKNGWYRCWAVGEGVLIP